MSREAVLARVRTALGRHGPDDDARAAAHAYIAGAAAGTAAGGVRRSCAVVSPRAIDMSSTVERVASDDAVPAAVARYLATINPGAGGLLPTGVCWPEFATLDWTQAGLSIESRPTVGHDALGVTGCFCAIAETGTLVFLTGTESPSARFCCLKRMLRLFAPTRSCAAMEDAFALIRARRGTLPRAVNLVSGPSRTGDIEQTIVLGAHGPRRLHIVLVG